jgi:hypothetical protein
MVRYLPWSDCFWQIPTSPKDCYRSILLKKSASISTAEKYASEIEIRVLSRRFRAQI